MVPNCVEELRPVEAYVAVTPICRIEMAIAKVGHRPDCVSPRRDPEFVDQERLIVVEALLVSRTRVQTSDPAIAIAAEAKSFDDPIPDHLQDLLAGGLDPLLSGWREATSSSTPQACPRIFGGRVPADKQRHGRGQG
jgi:hypothetical protein